MMSERLVEFLYILARDELQMGAIEDILWGHVSGGEPDSYCNPYLEAYARDLANRLTDDSLSITNWKHMYKAPGEVKGILEPEVSTADRPEPSDVEYREDWTVKIGPTR